MKKEKRIPATGAHGVVFRSIDGKSMWFRVYGKDFEFKDYEILHSDLRVRILDHDADFVEVNGELYLDHNESTLGLK
jgi:hypothetical protein